MLYEIRRYRALPGRRDAWIDFMFETILPLHAAAGVLVIGTFIDEDDDDVYVWIRGFDDEAARMAGYRAIYESDTWLSSIGPRIGEFLDRESLTTMTVRPTPGTRLAS